MQPLKPNPKICGDSKQVKFIVAVPKPLATQIAHVCNAEAMGRAELCRMALREYLERHYDYRRERHKLKIEE